MKPFPLCAWVGLALFSCQTAPATPRLFSKNPYLQSPGPEAMVITWESLTNYPGRVRFGQAGRLDQTTDAVVPRLMTSVSTTSKAKVVLVRTNAVVTFTNRWRVFTRTNQVTLARTNTTRITQTNFFYLYEAPLRKLEPGTEYFYQAEMDGTRTRPRTFRTFPRETGTVRFVAYGDSRSNPRVHQALASRFGRGAPQFLLHTGDLVRDGRLYDLWSKEFFDPLAGVIERVPFFPAIGNHEENGLNYLDYFHALTNKFYYSFDAGPVHVLVLDYYSEATYTEQYRYATNDLATTRAPWKIVMVHMPVFNIGGYGTGWGHSDFLPLFHRAHVDLVICGHSHLYERFRPVVSRRGEAGWPITFIVTGGGGAEFHPSHDHPALRVGESVNHFLEFEVTPDTLRAKAIRLNGTLLDSFEWKKTDGRLPDDYLAQAYSEEALKLYPELRPSLAGRASALPTRKASAKVMFSFSPRRVGRSPAALEISLAPESAPYYVLENGPVLAATPERGRPTNVRATVRATGKKQISQDKERNLSPPLIFQARVKASEGETLVYGTKSRFSKTAEDAAKKLEEPSR